ncbi:MAG: hypothetical protein COV70_03025 [Parcubacteria group bacterium CG11_big_fil_rev_8_21_14_0_20_39_22]|nr:MAG: hypothetical protein COV70_03025 [Parcubacteria group bacterium CG11_big_fil_rev_8_21_14_0_20_39_22]
MTLETWNQVLRESFTEMWVGIAEFLPNLIIALVIFLIGWAIGGLLGRVVAQIVRAIKVDSVLRGAKIEEVLQRAGFKLDSGEFLGALVKWFIIVVFLVASLDVLGLTQVNSFLEEVVLLYLPQVIVAVLILLAAALIADALQKIVVGAAQAAGVTEANFLGVAAKWAIWIFAILAALFQLGIASVFVQTLFTGVVVALALGFGLAFGLGGRDAAAKFIERVKGEMRGKNSL